MRCVAFLCLAATALPFVAATPTPRLHHKLRDPSTRLIDSEHIQARQLRNADYHVAKLGRPRDTSTATNEREVPRDHSTRMAATPRSKSQIFGSKSSKILARPTVTLSRRQVPEKGHEKSQDDLDRPILKRQAPTPSTPSGSANNNTQPQANKPVVPPAQVQSNVTSTTARVVEAVTRVAQNVRPSVAANA
ncbi:hypothetical protein AX16_006880 [Volvariella volvacea WC 439]|nr:hypothetical protein AX16_006880 [Volvariella volvacea WC 439]